jgi:hypothetical protein
MVDQWGSWVANFGTKRIRIGATIVPYVFSDRIDFYLGVDFESEYAINDPSNEWRVTGDWTRDWDDVSGGVNIPSGGGTKVLWSEAVSSGHLYRVYGSPGQTLTASMTASIRNLFEDNKTATVSYSESATIPAVKPSAPALTATTSSASAISLSWTAPNNGGSTITGYTLQRSTSSTSGFTTIYTGTGRTFSSTGLTRATTYYYRVLATNSVGSSSYSTVRSATTLALAPNAPTAFTATPDVTTVELSWTAPTNNGGSAITGYTVKRGTTTLGHTGTGTTFTDTGLTPATAYSYTVAAVNAIGTSPTASVSTTTIGGVVNYWNGTAYVKILPKIWNGTAWVDANARIWNGTEWKYGI